MDNKYLQHIGAYKASINQIINKDANGKTKAAYYIEFKDAQGRIVSTRMNKPFNDFDYSKTAKLLNLFRGGYNKERCVEAGENKCVAALNGLVEKELVIFVKPNEYQGKTFYQVSDFVDVSFAKDIEGGDNDDNPFGDNNPVDTALDAFQGAQETQREGDDIPF